MKKEKMIITESKPYEEIRKQLKKSDKIGVVSCGSCAKICGTGGEKAMKKLALNLQKDGFKVVDMDLIGVPCNIAQLEKAQFHGNVSVVLACDAGVENLRHVLDKNHKIIGALESIGVGRVDKKGKPHLVRKFK